MAILRAPPAARSPDASRPPLPSARSGARGVLIGALLLAGMTAFLASAFGPLAAWPAGVLVWAGALCAAPRIDSATRRLSLGLTIAGAAALLAALGAGVTLDATATAERLLTINLPIVGLFVGVAFLTLANSGAASVVINLSMTALAGDRMARAGRQIGRAHV